MARDTSEREPPISFVPALLLDVLALTAAILVWLVIAVLVWFPSMAIPPMFVALGIAVILGPGATWAFIAPQWGEMPPSRWVFAPIVTGLLIASLATAAMAGPVGTPGPLTLFVLSSIVAVASLLLGVAVVRIAPGNELP